MSPSTERFDLTRRHLLRRAGLAAVAAGPAAGLLSACATGGGEEGGGENRGEVSEENPLGVPADAPLDVVIFDGGFGDQYAKFHQSLYQKKYPKAKIKHTATQEIRQTLQPRFVGGNPPDVIDNSGANQMDMNGLVSDGQLRKLDEVLDAPSIDDPETTVRDTLVKGATEVGTYGDGLYALNYAYTVYGVWYSGSTMQKHGWEVPKTWDEMIALCAEIKKAGIAPWTYQGQHPIYATWPILELAAKHGGHEVIVNIDNLEPNAWKQDAVLAAATAMHELAAKGYIMKGTAGLDHIQSQTAWNQGKAVFIPCGSWLENEQKDVTPEGFDMKVTPMPSIDSSDKLPFEAIRGSAGEPFIVPSKGKNPVGGLEYLRIMLSKDGAQKFSELVSSLTIVKGATEGLEMPSGLASAQAVIDAAGDNVINWLYEGWYAEMRKPGIADPTGALLSNRIKPQEWATQCQAAADKTAKDDSIKKYKRQA